MIKLYSERATLFFVHFSWAPKITATNIAVRAELGRLSIEHFFVSPYLTLQDWFLKIIILHFYTLYDSCGKHCSTPMILILGKHRQRIIFKQRKLRLNNYDSIFFFIFESLIDNLCDLCFGNSCWQDTTPLSFFFVKFKAFIKTLASVSLIIQLASSSKSWIF